MNTVKNVFVGSAVVLLLAAGCTAASTSSNLPQATATDETASSEVADSTESADSAEISGVTAVEATSSGDGYRFAVTVESDETGCEQYADWWEVVTPEGELLYRRILAHSHVDEQPFTRSGGPVMVGEGDVVVRSHTNTEGYSTKAMKGSVSEGFSPTILAEDFAINLAEADPQPSGCAF